MDCEDIGAETQAVDDIGEVELGELGSSPIGMTRRGIGIPDRADRSIGSSSCWFKVRLRVGLTAGFRVTITRLRLS